MSDPMTDHGAAGFCTDHAQAPDERVETVARVLREHWPYYDRCRCGWRTAGEVVLTAVDHRTHMAAAVVAALDQQPRTALRRLWEERQEARAALDRVRALADRWEQRDPSGLAHVTLRAALDPKGRWAQAELDAAQERARVLAGELAAQVSNDPEEPR